VHGIAERLQCGAKERHGAVRIGDEQFDMIDHGQYLD
jgi:hypothetical protein